MTRNSPRKPLRLGALLPLALLACLSSPLCAELAALVHDTSDDSLKVVTVDSSNGSVAAGSASAVDCCFVSAGMTAADVAGRRFFASGREIAGGGFGDPVLVQFGFDGNSVTSVVPARLPQGVLAFDSAMGRLLSFEFGTDFTAPTLQLIAIDPLDGSVTEIGSENAVCCELLTGVSAIDGVAQRLYFVGRDFTTSPWLIQSASLVDGSVTQIGPLPAGGRPAFLSLDAARTHLEIYMQESTGGAAGLHRVNVGTGSASAISVEADDNCCLVGIGETVSRDSAGLAWWMAGSGSGLTPSTGFMALPTSFDIPSVPSRSVGGGYAIRALIVDGAVANPFSLFSDRFEL